MRKLATILFADVVSSTVRAEALDPEDIRELMSGYFAAMSEEITAEGGTVEKFIGDAVMAVFGVPQAHEDDALRAVRAARRMMQRLEALNAHTDAQSQIQLRIGINTGEVVAAGDASRDLLVTGDAVNVAARLQQMADPGAIVVGERTMTAVRPFFRTSQLAATTPKGKSAPLTPWLVETERESAEPRGVPGLHAPLVGRAEEMALLETMFARVESDGRPQLVTVLGDAGVGKSRLVREFVDGVAARSELAVGRCLPYGEGISLWPLAEILKDRTSILETDPSELAYEKLAAFARSDLKDASDDRIIALASTLNLPPPTAGAQLDPKTLRKELFAAWRDLLSSAAAARPLIVVIEDIHWADDVLLALLDDLAERIQAAILFVCTARPDLTRTRPEWGGGRRNFSSVPLDPLTRQESAELVSSLLEVENLPARLKEDILQRSEGNPFYLEEIIRRLIDEGHLIRRDDRWVALAGIETVDIPDTVQGVILARLDLLSPDEKRVAQRAAVVGRTFWRGTVEELVDAVDVDEVLRTLRRRELVLERGSSSMAGEEEYIFKHVLIRDVAYESIPRKRRGALHAATARWIEDKSGDRSEDLAELLVHHYRVAHSYVGGDELRRSARLYAIAASKNAMRRFATGQAETFGDLMIELSGDAAERIDSFRRLGDMYVNSFQGNKAWDAYITGMEEALAAEPVNRSSVARLASRAAIAAARWTGSLDRTVPTDEVQRVIEIGLDAAGTEDTRERARLLACPSFLEMMDLRSLTPDGDRPAREALEIAERLGDPDLISETLDAVGGRLMPANRYGEVLELNKRRLKLVPQLSSVAEICDAFAMAAWSSVFVGRYEDSVRYASECIEHARGKIPGSYSHGLAWRICARFFTGDWHGALRDQEEMEQLVSDVDRELPPSYAMSGFSSALLCREFRGEGEEADRLLDLSRRYAEARPDRFEISLSAAHLAWVTGRRQGVEEGLRMMNLDEGNWTRAMGLQVACDLLADSPGYEGTQTYLEIAARSAAENGLEALGFHADRLAGALAAQEGRVEEALALFARSAAGFKGCGAPWAEAYSHLLRAELAATAGYGSTVAESALVAHAIFSGLGSVQEIQRCETLPAQV